MQWERFLKAVSIISVAYAAGMIAAGSMVVPHTGPMALVAATAALAVANTILPALYLLKGARRPGPVLLAAAAQLALLYLIHPQLFALGGEAFYQLSKAAPGAAAPVPGLPDWLGPVGRHLLGAVDLADILMMLDILPPADIVPVSAVPAAAFALMSLTAAAVLLWLILRPLTHRMPEADELPAAARVGLPAFVAVAMVLTALLAWLDAWPMGAMLLYPAQSVAAALDIGDLLNIFGLMADHPPAGMGLEILALLIRLATLTILAWLLCRLAARMGAPEATSLSALSAIFLSGEEPLEKRVAAIRSVARYSALDDSGVGPLIRALADREPEVRAAAAETLNELNPDWADSPAAAEAAPELIKILGRRDKGARIAAADALGGMGPAAADAVGGLMAELSEPDPEVRAHMLRAILAIGAVYPEMAPKLTDQIADEDEAVREAARELMTTIGPPAIPPLVKLLVSEDANQRAAAVATLDIIDPGWTESEEAKTALSHFTHAVKTQFGAARISAINALASLGPGARPTLPFLVSLLTDGDRDVRAAAIQALKKVDAKWTSSREAGAAVPDLVRALADSDRNIQATVAKVLEKVDPDWAGRPATHQEIGLFEKKLKHPLDTVRVAAANALKQIGPPAADAAPALIALLSDKAPAARSAAAAALERVAPGWRDETMIQKQLAQLIEQLDSEDWRQRAAAATALGEMGPAFAPKAMPPLVERLTDPDRNVRPAVREALKKIDPRWPLTKLARNRIPVLMQSLGDSKWAVRAAAIEALGLFGPSAAKVTSPRLMKMMNTDSIMDVRSMAKKTLAKVDPEGRYHQKAGA